MIRFISLILVFFITFNITANAENLNDDLKNLTKEIKLLKSKADSYKSEQSRIEKKLAHIETDISRTISNIRNTKNNISTINAELTELTKKETIFINSIDTQKKHIQQQVLAAYQLGNSQKIKLLLNQENPERVSRTLQYYHYFTVAREKEILNYIDLLYSVKKVREKKIVKSKELKEKQTKLLDEKAELNEQKKSRESTIQKIQADLKTTEQKIKNREKERKELEALLKSVRESITSIVIPGDTKPFTMMRGKLQWPIKNKKTINSFNSKRDDSPLRWQGLLLQSNEGEEVRAIYNGRVVFSDWFKGYGLLTIIDHGNGYLSLYAHNQSLLKEAGEWVNSDTIIATVGNSGGNNKTALYFEIRFKGEPINPALWCQ